LALRLAPSVCETETTGIVMLGSVPTIIGGAPATLLAMTSPVAPAAWTFTAFWVKLQEPLSTRAIWPLTCPPFVRAKQASDGVVAMSVPETPVSVSAAPKLAVPTSWFPATAGGAVTKRNGLAAR
jgi:hypothetical protein